MTSIALTTVFTPPASCFDNSYTPYGTHPNLYAKDRGYESLQCYPSGFDALGYGETPFRPGVCPESYTVDSRGDWLKIQSGPVLSCICCPLRSVERSGRDCLGKPAFADADSAMTFSWDLDNLGRRLLCFADVETETELMLPSQTGVTTVQDARLGMQAILVAPLLGDPSDSSDSSILIGDPVSTAITTSSSSTETYASTPIPMPRLPPATSVFAKSTSAPTTSDPMTTSTRDAEPISTDSVGGVTQDILSNMTAFSLPTASTTRSPPPTTSHPPHHLSPGTIVGISIGAIASFAVVASLSATAVYIRRRRKRLAKAGEAVDVRVFDTAAEFHHDKRHWSQFSSPVLREVTAREQDVGFPGADSRPVIWDVAELEGD